MMVLDTGRVLPRMDDVIDDFAPTNAVFHLRKHDRTETAHLFCVARHNIEIRAHGLGQVGFVDHQQVGLRDAGAAFARDLVAAGNVDDLNRVIRQFAAEAGGQIVATRLDEQDIRPELAMQFFQREQVRGNVFSDGCVRAAAGFEGANPFWFQRVVSHQELTVLLREDIVGNRRDRQRLAEAPAKLQHQRGLAAPDRPTHADCKGALGKVARQRQGAFMKMPRMVQVLVGVAMRSVVVVMRVMRMIHAKLALKES